MPERKNEIYKRLLPHSYRGEPVDLPGLHLVWIEELGRFAIVRFFREASGGNAAVPLTYDRDAALAHRRLERYQRMLQLALAKLDGRTASQQGAA